MSRGGGGNKSAAPLSKPIANVLSVVQYIETFKGIFGSKSKASVLTVSGSSPEK